MKKEDIISFIRAHKVEFERKFGVKKIGLFGSFARGKPYKDSDIDIVVEISRPDMFHIIGIKQTIEEAFGRKVDIVRLREKMNRALESRIKRDAIYV